MTYVDPHEIERTRVNPLRRAVLLVSRAIAFLVYAWVLVVEIILTLGFVMLLLGANPSSSFVEWVYRSLDRTMRPFRGIFEPIELGTAGNDVPSVFETSVLFAMIVYAIVALVVHALLEWLNSRMARIEREDEEYRRQQLILKAASPSAGLSPRPEPPTGAAPVPPPPGGSSPQPPPPA
jgi:hypothetical protein